MSLDKGIWAIAAALSIYGYRGAMGGGHAGGRMSGHGGARHR